MFWWFGKSPRLTEFVIRAKSLSNRRNWIIADCWAFFSYWFSIVHKFRHFHRFSRLARRPQWEGILHLPQQTILDVYFYEYFFFLKKYAPANPHWSFCFFCTFLSIQKKITYSRISLQLIIIIHLFNGVLCWYNQELEGRGGWKTNWRLFVFFFFKLNKKNFGAPVGSRFFSLNSSSVFTIKRFYLPR